MSSVYYVYMLIDPRDGIPFYVGKGRDQRMYAHRAEALSASTSNKPHHDRIVEIVEDGLDVVYAKHAKNLEECEALNLERSLIEKIGRSNHGKGPLLNLTAGGQRGGAITKPVTQYTLDGEFVRHWESAKEASEKTPANRSYITQVCKGKRVSAGGFLWTYKGEPTPVYRKKYYQAVQQFDLEGSLFAEYFSLTNAQESTGIELHAISEACRGNSKTAGGFRWKYST